MRKIRQDVRRLEVWHSYPNANLSLLARRGVTLDYYLCRGLLVPLLDCKENILSIFDASCSYSFKRNGFLEDIVKSALILLRLCLLRGR
jgi:hypothetical protein